MPVREPVLIGGTSGYRLRHVGPVANVWSNPPVALPMPALLNQPQLVSRPLPMSDAPGSPDFSDGQWTGRVLDAGDGIANFPNAIAADGVPWRDRFDSSGHNQWLEVYNDGYLESVFCVVVVNKQMPAVQVTGLDGYFMAKKAFERDWTVVQAPRDVIERGTHLWQQVVSDNFPAGALNPQWNPQALFGGTAPAIARSGGCVLAVPANGTISQTQTQGAGAGANNNLAGSLVWSNPGRITKSDASAALAANTGGGSGGGGIGPPTTVNSEYLVATSFGFNIPAGATITGIQAKVKRYCPGGASDNHVYIVQGGTIQTGGTDQKSGSWSPTAWETQSYGGGGDLWGISWTVGQITAPGFGVAIQAAVNGGATAHVDYISIVVRYNYTSTTVPESAIQTSPITVDATGAWSAVAQVQYTTLAGASYGNLVVTEATPGGDTIGDTYELDFYGGANQTANLVVTPANNASPSPVTVLSAAIPTAPSYTLQLESDGEWVSAFVNGKLIGPAMYRRLTAQTTTLQMSVGIVNPANTTAATATITGVFFKCLQPFLMAGTDKGDYVLPGNATTYPNGGLDARYFNNAHLASDGHILGKIHSPPTTQLYGGSGTVPEYANQQDPLTGSGVINNQQNPSGAATAWWSVIWSGAIWLPLSQGDFTFQVVLPTGANNAALRVWVGKTQFGTQVVDAWTWTNGSAANFSFNVTATPGVDGTQTLAGGTNYTVHLPGTLPGGTQTVKRDGWYPIKIEYAVKGGNTGTAPLLVMSYSPAAYIDPGGTSAAAGSNPFGLLIPLPGTSCSPLGCVTQRFQGQSHYDMAQQIAQAYDYQFTVEPYRLETLELSNQPGYFPGQMAPRIREGQDVDVILEPDTSPRKEAILNYGSQEDATDFASSLQGNGAGFQNGSTGQLQGIVYDPVTLTDSLFDVEGWQDFSDASFGPLLIALLNSQLGLKLTPWQLVTADPMGRERLARGFPLPGNLRAMRWRPGDGVRLRARDVSLWDTVPRQLLTIQRNFVPLGVTGTTVGWANRPKGSTRANRQLFFSLSRLQRSKQRQLVTLTGEYQDKITILAGATSGYPSYVSLHPGDVIVNARLRVNFNNTKLSGAGSAEPFNVLVNAVDKTTTLNGPWTTVPIILPLEAVAGPDANNQLSVTLTNNSGSSCLYSYQLLVDVLR